MNLSPEESNAIDRFCFLGAVKRHQLVETLIRDGIRRMMKDKRFQVEALRMAKECDP